MPTANEPGTLTAAAEPEEDLLLAPDDADDSEPSADLVPPEESTEDSTPETEPPAQEPDWAAIVAENPNRIAEVPKRQLPSVLEQLQQKRDQEWNNRLAWEQHQANQRAQEAYQQALEAGRQRATAEAEARSIDALLDDDSDYEKLQTFARLQKQQPDLIRRYWQTKQNVAQQPSPLTAMQAEVHQHWYDEMQRITASIPQEHQQSIVANLSALAQQGRYPATKQGHAQYAADVKWYMDQVPKPEKQSEPRTGNQKVKEAAKAEVTGGNGSRPGKLTTERFMKLPPEEQARMWKERPDEVMALK